MYIEKESKKSVIDTYTKKADNISFYMKKCYCIGKNTPEDGNTL
ncbi:hypothetical protein [Ehrlichia muris]|nr:hypothetical protein [Ehrlichia muris]